MAYDFENQEEFENVLNVFKAKYPQRNIKLVWDRDRHLVCVDGEAKFCPNGYNLLYNLKRLCDALEDELM